MTVCGAVRQVCRVSLADGEKLGVRWSCDKAGRIEAVTVDPNGRGCAAGITKDAVLVSIRGVEAPCNPSQEQLQEMFAELAKCGGGDVVVMARRTPACPIAGKRTPFDKKKRKPALASLVSTSSSCSLSSEEACSFSNGSFGDMRANRTRRARSCELYLSSLDLEHEEGNMSGSEANASLSFDRTDTFNTYTSSDGEPEVEGDAQEGSVAVCSSPENQAVPPRYHPSCPRIISCLKNPSGPECQRSRRARSDAVKRMSWAPGVTTPTCARLTQSFSSYPKVSWDSVSE